MSNLFRNFSGQQQKNTAIWYDLKQQFNQINVAKVP